MRITESARKHGVTDSDILHALRVPVRVFDQGTVQLFIGAAQDGTMLEVGVLSTDTEDVIIHAMKARRKFWP